MLYLLDPNNPDAPFPDAETAEQEPNGLLAVGGDLSVSRLLHAYRQGIFPWYSEDQPILWWSPNPRLVLFPEKLKISRSLAKTLRKRRFEVSIDRDFGGVVEHCAAPRDGSEGTWILPEVAEAYRQLHLNRFAHSVEVWLNGDLVGGLYGVALGRVFFGESMFSRTSDASKVALVHLVDRLTTWNFQMVDCQIYSKHLTSLGAEEIERIRFKSYLDRWCVLPPHPESWRSDTRESAYSSKAHADDGR